jgi:hypothetical protein
MRLTVNEAKTRVCRGPDEPFDFLGYTFGRCWSPKTGRRYIGTRPSKKRIARLRQAIREATGRGKTYEEVPDKVAELNRMLIGWSNYFCLGPVSRAYKAVESHARHRLRQWLRAKHRGRGSGGPRLTIAHLHEGLGLVRLVDRTRDFPWANA